MSISIPRSHRDLFESSVHGVLTTVMPDGAPQSSIVWVDYNGENVLLNTTLERQKGRNMGMNPKVAILVIDPKNTSRWIQIQGRVTGLKTEGASAHADALTQRYTTKTRFYGEIYPPEQQQRETRVIVTVEPTNVTLDAIFK